MIKKKSYPAGKRGLAPRHPGTMWRRIIKEGLEISISEAAERMEVSRQQLHRLLNGESPVSPNLALRFSHLCDKGDSSAEFWLRLQTTYDLWRAKDELKQAIKRVRPVKKKLAKAA